MTTKKENEKSGSSTAPLRALIVEDNPRDLKLTIATLERAGYTLKYVAVDEPAMLQKELEEGAYEVIISDFNLRSWTAIDGLEIVKDSGKDIPFIVVTGSLGDESAVECLKHGATDFVLKDRMARLPLAVESALNEKQSRHERQRVEMENLRLKQAIEQAAEAIMITDPAGVIQYINPAFTQITGYTSKEAINQNSRLLKSGGQDDEFYRGLWKTIQSGKTWQGEIVNRRKDGSLYREWMTISPVHDSAGGIINYIAIKEDITERKQAEAALRKLTERLDLSLESAQLGIWDRNFEDNGVVWDVRQHALFGLKPGEFGGTFNDFIERVHLDDRQGIEKLLSNSIEGGGGFETEFRTVWPDESLHVIATRGTMHYKKDGRPDRMTGVCWDITKQKALEQQFRQSQKIEAVGQLAGGVAHDFNNLLTVINGYSEVMLGEFKPDDPRLRYINEIKRAGDRAASLTRQLLAFSRRQVLLPQVLDLNQVVANVHSILHRLIGEDIDLVTTPGKDLGRVKADPGQVEQILLNLAVNARDAMSRGGKLTIETSNVELDPSDAALHLGAKPGPHVMLAVSDTGTGIDAETQKHMFEPFFTTKEKGRGTGLGLSTVYGIVDQSGGHISVCSELGHGTTFKVYLPAVDQPIEKAGPAKAKAKLPRGCETILLAEDEPSVRLLVRTTLDVNGYRTLEAANAIEALSIAEKHQGPIHLLLTDLVMPGMSGRELAERMAALYPETKMLFMSGYTDDVVVRHGGLGAGMEFLQKPFTPDMLARKVRDVLDSQQAKAA